MQTRNPHLPSFKFTENTNSRFPKLGRVSEDVRQVVEELDRYFMRATDFDIHEVIYPGYLRWSVLDVAVSEGCVAVLVHKRQLSDSGRLSDASVVVLITKDDTYEVSKTYRLRSGTNELHPYSLGGFRDSEFVRVLGLRPEELVVVVETLEGKPIELKVGLGQKWPKVQAPNQ